MSDEHDGKGTKWLASYPGVILDNADPERRGRAKVAVEGLIEESDWADPFGVVGGGVPHRGLYAPPAKGAVVLVMFLGGDVEHPVWTPLGWPVDAAGKSTVPGPVGGWGPVNRETLEPGAPEDIAAADAPDVWALETAAYAIVLDDRAGKQGVRIEDKVSGDHFLLYRGDGKYVLDLVSTATLVVRCDGIARIEGGQLSIQGRNVEKNGRSVG